MIVFRCTWSETYSRGEYMYPYRRPPRPKKPAVPKILYLVLAIVLLVSGAVITNYIYNDFLYTHGHNVVLAAHNQPDNNYDYMPTPVPMPVHTPIPLIEPETEPEYAPDPTPTPEPREARQEFLDYRIHYDNDDIIGHIWIPYTTVNYLVAQGSDNEFYLYHNLRGRRWRPGAIFLDYLADIYNPGDHNWVIYGHNMGENHMFHMVRHFLREDFFHANRYIHFSTIYADYVFEVFSAYVAHVNHPYIWPRYGDWDYKINYFRSLSQFDAGINVSGDDRILTLSTCDNRYIDWRIVVHAVLISDI